MLSEIFYPLDDFKWKRFNFLSGIFFLVIKNWFLQISHISVGKDLDPDDSISDNGAFNMRQKKINCGNILKINEGAKTGTKIEFPFIQRNWEKNWIVSEARDFPTRAWLMALKLWISVGHIM